MRFDEALEYIHNTLKFGMKMGLENVSYLLRLLGNPHKRLRCIHIAGTNGKGSVAAMTSSILSEAGYKVGLFISPYLEDFCERIQINGVPISKNDVARITELIKTKVDQMISESHSHPTEFEIVTAIGMYYFAEQNVDYAVIEVGLGGRLDATNVIDPLISVITSVDYDHKEILGDTLSQIAYEKAGIIKKRRPVIVYPQQQEAMNVIRQVCLERNSPLIEVSNDDVMLVNDSLDGQYFDYHKGQWNFDSLFIPLLGNHQLLNAATSIAAVITLREYYYINISDKAIRSGLSKTKWPGRLELVHRMPYVLLDGAHNPQGAHSLAMALNHYFPNKRIIMVLGILKDKEIEKILSELIPLASYIIMTKPDSPRAASPDELLSIAKEKNVDNIAIEDIKQAVQTALSMANADDVVVISGSLYLVGKARTYLKEVYNFK